MNVSLDSQFSTLFEEHVDYVCHSLRRLGVREADIDDLAQEVFVTVHGRLADYDSSRPLRPWLFSFVCRLAANYRRLKRHRSELLSQNEQESPAVSSEKAGAAVEARQALLIALQQLPFKRQVPFIMHDLDGMTAAEIADALHLPVDTVYSQIRVARKEMRAALVEVTGGTP